MKKWKAVLKDGNIVDEDVITPNWPQIQKEVSELELNNDGQIIKLPPNMSEYIQGKTASGDLISGKCKIESRFLGFTLGNNTIQIRVDEKTGNINLEII